MSTNTTTYPKLDPDFKAKWVEALRSGEYKQAKGALIYMGHGHCCLGIAGIIAGVPDERMRVMGVLGTALVLDGFNIPNVITGNGMNNMVVKELCSMNDGGKSFSEIADWIEENL